jgi:chemotaxis protein MotB
LKTKKKTDETDSGRWIVTFTNLVLLLLAFFIVLVNMSVIDDQRKRLGLNSLFGSFGIKPGGQSPIGKPRGSDITMPSAPMEKKDVDFADLGNIAFANGIESDVKIKKEVEKIVITLSNRVLFDKGSSRIPEDRVKFLADLSGVLRDGLGLIELRGYADQAETVFESDSFEKSVYLSTKRALSILRFLVDKGEIPVHRIVAHGFAAPPIGKASLMKKSEWRRQVEIIVDYRQKIPYRLKLPKQRGRVLDYKGFFFELYGDSND